MRALALATLLLAPAAAAAQDPANDLLRDLGLAPAAQLVTVQALRRADGLVVVTLTPQGAVKLVADPGVSVVPVDQAGLPVADPVAMLDRAKEYFPLPPSLVVHPGTAAALKVEYAYCVVAKQCLFGDVTVAIPPPA
ncbi:MAG TPA: hypothetical protein VHL31_24840 [Geminicoccus sp.]|jgi:hypothetical protein|uniref:hypothetical protein n=1 Tax=Geminicoccus sp. TaxID=2024832 RepID=UPI002E32D3ED|nr:hypothetical protein [Geminicoccus sp.]HEX2529508.1 hypothetical protein [Geminicoccus sp.]